MNFSFERSASLPADNIFFNKVLGYFGLALLVSAFGVFAGFQFASIIMSKGFYFLAFIIELGLVFTARSWSQNLPLGYFLFALFAFISGITAVPILAFAGAVGGAPLIGKALLATTATFIAAAIVGATTKRNLSGLGGILSISIIGMIVVSLIGFFIPWGSGFEMLFAGFGVIIFSIYTAYDFQKIRSNQQGESALTAAMSLYLDIFNIFLFILRLMISLRN